MSKNGEPFSAVDGVVWDCNGLIVADFPGDADADYFVTRVNALAGIPTDALPTLMGDVRGVLKGVIDAWDRCIQEGQVPRFHGAEIDAAVALLHKLPTPASPKADG